MKVTPRDVALVVCARFHMDPELMRGPKRCRKIARPRQIAMFLSRELTGRSYPAIGKYFCRDHTTVLYAERRIRALMEKNPKVRAHVDGLRDAVLRREAA